MAGETRPELLMKQVKQTTRDDGLPCEGSWSFWLLHLANVLSMAAMLALETGQVSHGWSAGYVLGPQKGGK